MFFLLVYFQLRTGVIKSAPEGRGPQGTTILAESLEVFKVTVSFNCKCAGSLATGQLTLGQPSPEKIGRK